MMLLNFTNLVGDSFLEEGANFLRIGTNFPNLLGDSFAREALIFTNGYQFCLSGGGFFELVVPGAFSRPFEIVSFVVMLKLCHPNAGALLHRPYLPLISPSA